MMEDLRLNDLDASLGDVVGSPHDGLRRWAQLQSSPHDTAIGHLTADLCDLTAALAGPVKDGLRAAHNGVAGSDDLQANVRVYLQLARQADRFLRMAPLIKTHPPQAKNRTFDTGATPSPGSEWDQPQPRCRLEPPEEG